MTAGLDFSILSALPSCLRAGSERRDSAKRLVVAQTHQARRDLPFDECHFQAL